jgi:hypothetical protein
MADLRPWLKLWKTTYNDAQLSRLSMEDRGRWLWLLLYVSLNGERGRMVLAGGLQELRDVLATASRGPRDDSVRRILSRLPGVSICDADAPSHAVTITFDKWAKYQEDSSAERTRRWRQQRRHGDGIQPSQVTEHQRHTDDLGDGVRSRSRRDTPLPPASPRPLPDPFDWFNPEHWDLAMALPEDKRPPGWTAHRRRPGLQP